MWLIVDTAQLFSRKRFNCHVCSGDLYTVDYRYVKLLTIKVFERGFPVKLFIIFFDEKRLQFTYDSFEFRK